MEQITSNFQSNQEDEEESLKHEDCYCNLCSDRW